MRQMFLSLRSVKVTAPAIRYSILKSYREKGRNL
jgi:hypothetical protein